MSHSSHTQHATELFKHDVQNEEKGCTVHKKQMEKMRCNQCFSYQPKESGSLDQVNSLWYCFDCWFQFNLTLQNNDNSHKIQIDSTQTAVVSSASNTEFVSDPSSKSGTEPIGSLYDQIPIKLASSLSSLTSIVTELLSHNPLYIGIDLEWKPVFVKGAPRTKAALLQIASEELVVLIQLQQLQNAYDAFHSTGLLKLLMDTKVLKTGVGIVEDQQKLYNDYAITIRTCIDLNNLNLWPINEFGTFKLKDLCKKVLGYQMQYKSRKITMSNWEQTKLSERQILYAAEDAFISYRVFDEMLTRNNINSLEMLHKISAGQMNRCIVGNYGFDEMESLRNNMTKIGSAHAKFHLSTFRQVYGTTCGTMLMLNGKLSKIIAYFSDIFDYDKASNIVISKIYEESV